MSACGILRRRDCLPGLGFSEGNWNGLGGWRSESAEILCPLENATVGSCGLSSALMSDRIRAWLRDQPIQRQNVYSSVFLENMCRKDNLYKTNQIWSGKRGNP